MAQKEAWDRIHARKLKQNRLYRIKEKTDQAGLQRHLGNRALQRALVQRQGGSMPSDLDPAAVAQSIMAENERNKTAVRKWLTPNTNRLRLLTMDQLVSVVRRNVAEAGRLADVEIQEAVRQWASEQKVSIPALPISGTPAFASTITVQIPDAVKKAMTIAVDGVDVVKTSTGRINISVKGATASFGQVKTEVGWGGSLGIDIHIAGFQLAGKLDKDRWEINVSSPGEGALPDLSKLAETFHKGEIALRGMLNATAHMPNLDNVSEISAAITPHVAPAKEAVKALVDIAKSKPGLSFGVSVSGPTQPDHATGDAAEGGITVSATVTLQF